MFTTPWLPYFQQSAGQVAGWLDYSTSLFGSQRGGVEDHVSEQCTKDTGGTRRFNRCRRYTSLEPSLIE